MGACCSGLKPHEYDNIAQKESVSIDGITLDVESEGFTKRAVAYVNPVSGSGRSLKAVEVMKPIFKEAGCELIVRETEYASHMTTLANEEALDKVNYLISIGGDGSFHELVNGFISRPDYEEVKDKVALGVVPAGTGNTFAYDLSILSIEDSAKAIVSNKAREIDAIELTFPENPSEKPVYGCNIVGWSFSASVLTRYEAMRCLAFDCLRSNLYTIAGYCEVIANPSYSCKIEFPESTKIDPEVRKRLAEHTEVSYVQAQNTVYMGDKLPGAPSAVLDDGLLDLVVIKKVSRLGFVLVAEDLKGGTIHKVPEKGVDYIQTSEFTLTPTRKEQAGENSVNVDGNLVGLSPMKVRCINKAILVSC